MEHICKLLVVVEPEYDREAMMTEVTAVAGPSNAEVTLLGFTYPPPNDAKTEAVLSNLHEWETNEQLADLKAFSTELERSGIPAKIQQTNGKPYEETIRTAIRGGFDLIMKPAVGTRGKLEFLFGSTDMQLFRLSPIPVWIFKPTPSRRLARIMIAVDLLAFNKEKSALAEKILRLGKHVASLLDAELHVVHIWDFNQEFALRRTVEARAVDSLLSALEQRHRRWLDQALKQSDLDPKRITTHFRQGDAEEMIPAITRAQRIDLLVMGTVGRTGIPGFFIGNTADSVLRQVDCSVLAIKPDGFHTPIKIDE